MGSDILTLNIDKTDNIPMVLGRNSSFTISIKNISSNIRLYNLSLFITVPDGMNILSASLAQSSKVINTDGSAQYSWISLKDLAPMEISYTFDVTVDSKTMFSNGTIIPFGYVFSGITVKCQMDTQPRGDYDIGNQKIIVQKNMTFKTCRFSGNVTTNSKVLKGAGSLLSLKDYAKVYSVVCKFINNLITSSVVSISILLQDGIRYIGNISVSGTDATSFLNPIISTVSIDDKLYTQLYYSSVVLSINSNTTLNFNYAVWNQYNNNQGDLINHGTKLKILINMSSSEESVSSGISFAAMDLIVDTTVNKSVVDINNTLQYKYIYQVSQYYDMKDISIEYILPDGISYVTSSVHPYLVEDNAIIRAYRLVYKFPIASSNSQNTVMIEAKIDDLYKYKLNSNNDFMPVVSFDSFKARVGITGTTAQSLTVVSDDSNVSCSIVVPIIKKELIKTYYKNGIAKTFNTLAPGDFAEYKLTYDANSMKVVQKQIYIDDFFPLSADPIDELNYSFTGYKPAAITPKLIDPHGVDFYYGDIPSKSLITISYKVPIKFLGLSYQNINLMKLKGTNTDGYSYSDRIQTLINIGTPNLQLIKSVSGTNKNAIKAGEIYIFTVKITNTNSLGTETDAFKFQLKDSLSDWFTVNQNTIKVTGIGSYSSPEIEDNFIKLPINKLAPGQTLTLTYSVTVNQFIAPNVIINTTVSNTNPYSQQDDEGYQYTNQNKSVTLNLYSESITLIKSTNSKGLKVNSDVSYNLTLTIPKGTIAYGVYVKDTLPNGGQNYFGYAFRNGEPITASVNNNAITLSEEGTIDARNAVQTVNYTIYCKIINANKSVGAITSNQTNNCQVIYKQKQDGNANAISKNLNVTINHPNITMNLSGTDKSTSILYSQNANISVTSIMDFKLIFLNNSLVKLINGSIEIPINSNFTFVTINTMLLCSAVYDSNNKKIVISIPKLESNVSGVVSFTLIPLSSLRAGTSISIQAVALAYYSDISNKVYSGEKSNLFTCNLMPGTLLLPNITDKIDEGKSFRVTPPGGTAIIINNFQNIGGGYDDYTIIIKPVAIKYTLYINNIKIVDVLSNTLYQADLNIMKNIAPNETRIITINADIPKETALGTRFDFVVTVRSKTYPYPEKTILNIDPN